MIKLENTSYEIDSFTIQIPYEKVENISNILGSKVEILTTNTSSGVIIDDLTEFKTISSYYTDNLPIPTTYSLVHRYNNSKNVKSIEYYYNIAVSSKHLKELYFDGITNKNIKMVYDSIISQKIISFTYDDFLSSSCYDVDFKKDQYNEVYDNFKTKIYNSTIPSKQVGKGFKPFNSKKNKGFQFGTRKHATSSSPFIKYYNKELQASTIKKDGGMLEFYETYLKDIGYDLKDLYRLEYTIKGKDMFINYGLSGSNKLQDLLNIPNEVKKGIAKDIFCKHTEPLQAPKRISNKLTSNEKKHILIKDICIKLGMTYNEIENYIDGFNFRYEVKKSMLNDIKNIQFDDDENGISQKEKQNEKVEKLLIDLGFKENANLRL
jgi:hypothetical protein